LINQAIMPPPRQAAVSSTTQSLMQASKLSVATALTPSVAASLKIPYPVGAPIIPNLMIELVNLSIVRTITQGSDHSHFDVVLSDLSSPKDVIASYPNQRLIWQASDERDSGNEREASLMR
jgi:hypothetical protein